MIFFLKVVASLLAVVAIIYLVKLLLIWIVAKMFDKDMKDL